MTVTNNAGVQYIGDNGTDGTSIGSSATELVSFHGVTPVAQASAITSVATTASTTTTPYGFTTSTQAEAIVTAVNSIITALEDKGIIAS